jgi:8-oxo-dGTP pyrophosphatase MutT (NUDIX family)
MDEEVIIVDEHNKPTGKAYRSEMRKANLIHRAAYILVFNGGGELFVQKRTRTKDVFPGYYDLAAGGVVLADESYDDAAQRELAEELGILQAPLENLFDNFFEDDRCKVWGRVYRCVFDGKMTLQEAEIESGFFMNPDQILKKINPSQITPDSVQILKRYLK